MKKCAICMLVMVFLGVIADDGRSADDKVRQPGKESDAGLFIKYTPPMLGKPGKRVGGGTRGADTAVQSLIALVPDHLALTSTSQPLLCWFIGQPTKIPMEITLDDGKSLKPVLEKRLEQPDRKGIYCAELVGHGVSLKPAMEYQWFVTIIPDLEQRSKDIITGGSIIYVEPSKELARSLSRAGDVDAAAIFAGNGYWYDAVALMMKLIAAKPGDERLYKMRSQLFEQAGLPGYMGSGSDR